PLRGHKGWVRAVAFSPDGSRIASGSEDCTIRLWNVVTGQFIGQSFRAHEGWVLAIEFSPDGSQIVSGSSDGTIMLWDAKTDDCETEEVHGEPTRPAPGEHPGSAALGIIVPGFGYCSLLDDGWVVSSGKRLIWVPPDNRHGLRHPRLHLTLPTSSPLRATRLDFTNFQCGTSWTKVRSDTW
ncbi:hypothetical protein PIIN_10512, partial [Serendipita indica DSM 11827]